MDFSLTQSTVLSADEQLLLQEKLWELFAAAAKEFTNGESTSVSEENAGRLLSSVCFLLREHMDDTGEKERDLLYGDITAAFEHGKAVVLKRVTSPGSFGTKPCSRCRKYQAAPFRTLCRV